MIFFDEESHTYRLDDPISGELCISGTTFIGLFKNHFDMEFWSYYDGFRTLLKMEKKDFARMLARDFKFKFGDVKNIPTQDSIDRLTNIAWECSLDEDDLLDAQYRTKAKWKRENNEATTKGTAFHNMMEQRVYQEDGMMHYDEFAHLTQQVSDLTLLHVPNCKVIAPELRMYNRDYKLSGTADMVFIYPDKTFDIDDWKTNKEIKMENKFDKMKGPLQHLDDCNYNHYRLQVSLYAWILEQYGYTPRNLKFTHVVVDEFLNITDSTIYSTHYMKDEIENMLEYYSVNKDKLIADYKKFNK